LWYLYLYLRPQHFYRAHFSCDYDIESEEGRDAAVYRFDFKVLEIVTPVEDDDS
jgi:hypothetical protein